MPFLVPDAETAGRRFRFEKQPPGAPPLVFHNGWREENARKGIEACTPEILFAGTDLLVGADLRQQLLALEVRDLLVQPAVYVDDRMHRHEDYWYLTFSDRFDCWDKKASEFDEEEPPVQSGGHALHEVYRYSLDADLLQGEPRSLFKMGGDLAGNVVCHRSLAPIFQRDGVRPVPVGEY